MATPDEWFTQQLADFRAGIMHKQVQFDLGTARDFGIPNWQPVKIWMPQFVVTKAEKKHGIDLNSLLGLPSMMRAPIMIFRSRTETGVDAFTVLIDAMKGDEPLIVAVHCHRHQQLGLIHDVRSIHAKRPESLIYWYEQGDALYECKKTGRSWLQNSAPSN